METGYPISHVAYYCNYLKYYPTFADDFLVQIMSISPRIDHTIKCNKIAATGAETLTKQRNKVI